MAVDRGKQVRVTRASPLIAEALRLTGLEQFLEHGESIRQRLVEAGRGTMAVA
jgi:hypothetical protein